MDQEKSCGGIVFRKHQWVLEFLLVQQKQWGHRFFPKGHVEKGESEGQTALREIYEEVWLQVHILPKFRETYSYIIDVSNVEKIVVFFLCKALPWKLIMSDELQDVARLPYEHALQKLTHDNSKATLTKAYIFLLSL